MASYTYELLEEYGDEAHGLGCKCCRFSTGIDLPMPAKLSIDEIKRHGLKFSTAIFSDWIRLNAILKRYELTIRKRWLKKGTRQRREILLQAWPDMAAGHRPDFAGFRSTLKTAPRSRTCLSAAYLWPYINLEDLQQHHPLLLFLESRGRNLPEKFISADIEAAHLGKGWSLTPKAEGESMLFLGQCTPQSYGNVLSAKEVAPAPGATRMIHRLHPSMGLLALEIQAGIYSFLLKCALLVLHDIAPREFLLAPHQPVPPRIEPRMIQYRTLQDDALETPYCMPQKFDLTRLTQLVAARRSSAEDHIWMLREDPGYFIDTLKEEREHDREYTHNCPGTCRNCPGTWANVASKMISDAIGLFLFWDDIHQRLKSMPPLESQLKRANLKSMRLPRDVEQVWAELDEITGLMLVIPDYRLMIGLPISPRMRHCYPLHDKPNISMDDLWAFKPKCSEAESRVHRIFHAITDIDQSLLHGCHHLVQEAQYMLDTDPAACALVDSWLIGHFSDLALLSELKTRIDGLEPWSTTWRARGVTNSNRVTESVGKLLRLDSLLRDAMFTACRATDLLDDPTSSHWRYPADKAPNKANIDQMRHAEWHLDEYWMVIEDTVEGINGQSLTWVLATRGLHTRTLHRTPPWKEPIVLHPVAKPHVTDALRERDPNASSVQDSIDCMPAKTKAKVKTRGTPAAIPAQDRTALAEPVKDADVAPTTTVKLPKRAYKVFSALIPPLSAESHQRIELAWDELLHAMNTIGLQPEKLYGSVWMFRPVPKGECKVELDLKRSIQFHEPKEVRRGSKIPANMVRTFGRRLKHAYGWEAGMFECE